jgi:enoyl-CoA hydratase
MLWPLLIGHLRAKEYLFTGDAISAPEAARIGLINKAVPAALLDSEVYGLARRIAAGPSRAIRWTKTVANQALADALNLSIDAGLAYEIASQRLPDHKARVAAFRSRRKAAPAK